ncbi:MAG: hypothetical protein DWC06_03305 [Candidatus Poseidoniales archaeon]|nr:MAG: hypothetical protein DWC06_03305 [Candidatus Poseidoniales archaeon]
MNRAARACVGVDAMDTICGFREKIVFEDVSPRVSRHDLFLSWRDLKPRLMPTKKGFFARLV